MVARPGQYQASLNSGELSPSVWGRYDVKQFYSGASLMQNAEPVPQGGWAELPGTVDVGFVRGALTDVFGSRSDNLGPHGAPATITVFSLPTVSEIALIDLQGLAATTSVANLYFETSLDAITWQQIGGEMALPTPSVSRSFRRATPPGRPQLARYVRLRMAGTPGGPTTFSFSSILLYREGEPHLTARQFRHTATAAAALTVVVTPFNADIFSGDTYVGSAYVPHSVEQLPKLKAEQRYNTILLFQEAQPVWRLLRRDGDHDWVSSAAPFDNVPLADFGLAYANGLPDIWSIQFSYSGTMGAALLEMTVNEEAAAGVLFAGDWTAFADAIRGALEDLPSVGPGVTVTPISDGSSPETVQVSFGGANLGSRFSLIAKINNIDTTVAVASRLQLGKAGGEAIMSAFRGYPAHGTFYQDRLLLAGFRSEGGAVLGSVQGEYFDLNTAIENVAGAVLFRLDASGAEQIQYLAQLRHLMIFTNLAEYYISDRAIARGTPPNVPQSSRNGLADGCQPVENDGSMLYLGQSRSILYAATYSDVSQTYESAPISLLASHLVSGVSGPALQRASNSTDAARCFLWRDDGLLVVGVMIRNQEVTAFVRFVTDGKVRDVVVDGVNRVYLLVERMVAGVRRLVRERLDASALMHQTRTFSFPSPVTQITGLTDFEGVSVWLIADGYAEGPVTVTGGRVTLSQPSRTIEIGRWTPPIVDTLPVPRLVGERVQLARPVRVHTVRARSQGSTALAIGANGRPAREVPLLKGGQVSDQPIQPVFGAVEVSGLFGWSDDGIVRFTQTRPGRFRVRDITIEARI